MLGKSGKALGVYGNMQRSLKDCSQRSSTRRGNVLVASLSKSLKPLSLIALNVVVLTFFARTCFSVTHDYCYSFSWLPYSATSYMCLCNSLSHVSSTTFRVGYTFLKAVALIHFFQWLSTLKVKETASYIKAL